MLELLGLLWGTIVLRPYVFVFLLAYLALAVTAMGWRRTLAFTVLAYLMAFVCEWNAVYGNGFPFGRYVYLTTTSTRELWIAGVPFFDSLSFTFLNFIGLEMAVLLRSPVLVKATDVQVVLLRRVRRSWGTTLLAAFLMTYLDIVIDPVTLQGERWFLGNLYFYPNGGSYFGITLANFAGWFFVAVATLRLYLWIELRLGDRETGVGRFPFLGLAPAGFYFGILAFNLTITWMVRRDASDTTMFWGGCFISLALLVMTVNHLAVQRGMDLGRFLAEHRRDYPNSRLSKE